MGDKSICFRVVVHNNNNSGVEPVVRAARGDGRGFGCGDGHGFGWGVGYRSLEDDDVRYVAVVVAHVGLANGDDTRALGRIDVG